MIKIYYILCYDIPNDSLRTKTAKLCEAYGFERIQFSVFAAEQSRNMVEMLVMEIGDLFMKRLGKVVVIPICFKCLEKIAYIGMNSLSNPETKNKLGIEDERVMIV